MLAPFSLVSSTKVVTLGPAVNDQRRLPFGHLSDDLTRPWIATIDERSQGTFPLPASASCRIQEGLGVYMNIRETRRKEK
jgi:hypothetical protein